MIERAANEIRWCCAPRWAALDCCEPFRRCPLPYADALAIENRRYAEPIPDFPPARPTPLFLEPGPASSIPRREPAIPQRPGCGASAAPQTRPRDVPRLGEVLPVPEVRVERRIREYVRVSRVVGPGRFIDMLA